MTNNDFYNSPNINFLGSEFNSSRQQENDSSALEHELLIQIDIAETLGRNFVDAFIVDRETHESILVKRNGHILSPEERSTRQNYEAVWKDYVNTYLMPTERERVIEATKMDKVLDALSDGSDYSVIYRLLTSFEQSYYQVLFRNIWLSEQDKSAILMAFRCVDDIMSERIAHKVALDDSFSTVKALCYSYRNVTVVNMNTRLYQPVYSLETPEETILQEKECTWANRVDIILGKIKSEYTSQAREFYELSTLHERLNSKPFISFQFEEIGNTWVEASFIPSDYAKDGSLFHVIYTVRDITETKKQELNHQKALLEALEAAEQGSQAKSAFLTNMSHDLRTPMNAIISFAALASEHTQNPELVEDYLDKIKTSSNHLMSLINDILDMARLENGKVVLEKTFCSLTDIFYDIHNMVSLALEKKNLQLIFETKNLDDDFVYADKLRISRVLLNLISNSIKFTEPGGTISLALSQLPCAKEGYAMFEFVVKDTGIGMSKEFVSHAFEPFERENTATVSGIPGTGLGLSIAKNIVEMMDGAIVIESMPRVGTTFTITLDLQIANDKEKERLRLAQKSPENLLPNFAGKRILLVEDNKLNQEIATILLERFNFNVVPVEDGTDAVKEIKDKGPDAFDLVLMDIQMPQMDGYTATRKIREINGADSLNLPIVALTANAFEEDYKKAIDAGMNAHVSKPVNVEQLIDVLNTCLSE